MTEHGRLHIRDNGDVYDSTGQLIHKAKKRVIACGHPGELNPQAKLTEAQVLEIRRRYGAPGESLRTLAREFSVGATTIKQVIHRTTWNHI